LAVKPFIKYDIGGAYHWKWYLVNYDGYRDFTNLIVDLLPDSGRLLDVGCGDGLISYLFFRSGFDVVGFDTSETAIQLAKMVSERAVQNFMGADIKAVQGMPFTKGNQNLIKERWNQDALQFYKRSIYDFKESDSYDYAICSEVIEHLEHPQQLLENINRAVRKFAIITTPNGLLPDGSIDEPGAYDYHVWSPETFANLLQGYNFEFLDLKPGTISIKLHKN
jgi:2-polyprenyl-3-methyl-5-hydroxy-6-metoxy-1,4-benzoquinol methylase